MTAGAARLARPLLLFVLTVLLVLSGPTAMAVQETSTVGAAQTSTPGVQVTPSGGVQTGAGGTAREGLANDALLLVGIALVGGGLAGGFALLFRRRSSGA